MSVTDSAAIIDQDKLINVDAWKSAWWRVLGKSLLLKGADCVEVLADNTPENRALVTQLFNITQGAMLSYAEGPKLFIPEEGSNGKLKFALDLNGMQKKIALGAHDRKERYEVEALRELIDLSNDFTKYAMPDWSLHRETNDVANWVAKHIGNIAGNIVDYPLHPIDAELKDEQRVARAAALKQEATNLASVYGLLDGVHINYESRPPLEALYDFYSEQDADFAYDDQIAIRKATDDAVKILRSTFETRDKIVALMTPPANVEPFMAAIKNSIDHSVLRSVEGSMKGCKAGGRPDTQRLKDEIMMVAEFVHAQVPEMQLKELLREMHADVKAQAGSIDGPG